MTLEILNKSFAVSESFLRPITKENPFKICFVCLGNICRSPTAEGLFIHKVKEQGLQDYFYIDSAGTSAYHIGEKANSKSQAIAKKYGVHLPSIARQFYYEDLEEFDLILAMDSENFYKISSLDYKEQFSGKVHRIREFDPNDEDPDVPDPYFGGMDGFENVYQVLDRCCDNLLDVLKEHIQ